MNEDLRKEMEAEAEKLFGQYWWQETGAVDLATWMHDRLNRWVSVKDRLPESDGDYMGWKDGQRYPVTFDKDSETWESSHLLFPGLVEITHWRERPESPE